MTGLRIDRDGDILCLTLDAPPVNALGASLRRALWDAIEGADQDDGIRGVLITGAGRGFSAGADINEFNDIAKPGLAELCTRIEDLDKPVLALVHGNTLGGGCELALAAHYRMAAPDVRIGLPEVKLGLLPGAGGTQRLPRLIGAEAALEIMISGKPADAEKALGTGIIDRLAEGGDAPAEARAWLSDLIASGAAPPRTRECHDALAHADVYLAECATWRAALAGRRPEALGRIVDCVEAALLLPFAAGLTFEATAFADCLATESSIALRHVFLAQRRAARAARVAEPATLARIGIIGGGRIGVALAGVCLEAGLAVTMIEQHSYAAQRAERAIAAGFDRRVARGQITVQDRNRRVERFSCDLSALSLAGADAVIECIEDDLDQKIRVLSDAFTAVGPGTLLASTTSWLDLDRIGAALPDPESFAGFHVITPVVSTHVAEIVATQATGKRALATAAALAIAIGKTPVLTGRRPGYLVNRMLEALRHACDQMLEDGASVQDMDAALRDYGFALGPYQALDREGLDYSWRHRQALRDAGAAPREVTVADRLVEVGRLGRQSGHGFYAYDAEGQAEADPFVSDLIAAVRTQKGIVPRDYAAQEIVSRALDALANEGARALEDGTARSGGDIDVAMVLGAGYPRARGGPMLTADLGGLLALRRRLEGRAQDDADFWTPAPLIHRLVREGRHFTDTVL